MKNELDWFEQESGDYIIFNASKYTVEQATEIAKSECGLTDDDIFEESFTTEYVLKTI